jgi:hypothetical protein
VAQTVVPAPFETPVMNEAITEIESIQAEAEVLQQRLDAVAGRLAYAGPASTGFGPATDAITDEAAIVVDRRADAEFAAAPFDGDNVRAQGTLQRAATNLRFTLEGVTKTIVSLQSSATSQLGNTLYLVVDTTRGAVAHPFTADPAALRATGLRLLRRVDAYNESIQSKRGQNGRFRATIAEVQADNERLSTELQASQAVAHPSAAPSPAAPAGRTGRRTRRG